MALLAGGGFVVSVGGGKTLRSAPMMKNTMPIPMPEMKRESLRPRESTRKNTKSAVATTFTIPYIPEARSEFVVPVYPILHQHQSVQSSHSGERRRTEEKICGA